VSVISEVPETRSTQRSAQKARTRQTLLDAAVGLIREQGLPATTARAISDRAGVAPGTFFVHFPEVADLLDELLDQHLDRSLTRAYRSLPADATLVDAFVHVADALFAGYAREPELARSFLSSALFRVDVVGPTERRLSEFRTWVLDRLVRARASGELPAAIDITALFESFFCLYLGLVIGGLRGHMNRRRQREVLRTSLLSMIRNPA
jgi:AcrR family transcriptional regulator